MTTRKKKSLLEFLPGDESFLDPLRIDASTPEKARVVVIPFGYEATVSYGGGTHKGPAAILEASQQLELFDDEYWGEPYKKYGIAALREPKIAKSPEAALDQLEGLVSAVLDAGKVPFVLGGEHSITAGAIRPVVRRHPDLVVLHLDAHWDLRDGYLGNHFSHAAAMRRVLDQPGHENVTLVSLGIRGFSTPEAEFYEANRNRMHVAFGKDQPDWNLDAILKPLSGRPVYITFDIDALDATVMPATGTPTPFGMSYRLALEILRRGCAAAGQIVGMDLVEFAPIKRFHAYDFMAAQIAAKMMNYAFAGAPGAPASGNGMSRNSGV